MKYKYKKKLDQDPYMFGSLINDGVKALSKGLGANDNTAEIIGSSVATATGLIPGMQTNLIEGADLVGDIGSAAGDKSGVTNMVSQLGSIAAPLLAATEGAEIIGSAAQGADLVGDVTTPLLMANGGSLTEYNAGGTHEQNPNGGIPIGGNASVEEGETRDKDYIFSDRLKVNKKLQEEFNLPKKAIGKSFAEVSKMFNDGDYQNDVISKRGYEREVENLKKAQEAFKQVEGIDQPQGQQMQQQMAVGGFKPADINWNDISQQANNFYFDNMSVDEDALFESSGKGNIPDVNPNDILRTQQEKEKRKKQDDGDFSDMPNFGQKNKVMGPPAPSQTDSTINTDGDSNSLTNARYAPLASNLLNMGIDYMNKPTPKNLGMFDVNTEATPNYINMNQVKRDIDSQSNATRDTIRETSPSSGAMMSNLLGSQLQQNKAIGNAELQQQSLNNQEDSRIDQMNFQNNLNNSRSRMQVSQFNDADLAAYQDNMRDGISSLGQNIGNVGLDEMYREMVKGMALDYFTSRDGKTKFKTNP